ncbi:MAG: GNAT family protein [Rubrivivax sp.]
MTAGTLACNLAMISVAERSGMQREGVRAAQEVVAGVPADIVFFARFATQPLPRRKRSSAGRTPKRSTRTTPQPRHDA